MLLVIGSDPALLEGLLQQFAAAGIRADAMSSIADASETTHAELPLLLVVERKLLSRAAEPLLGRLPLAPGGAIVSFHSAGEAAEGISLPLPLSRALMAQLELPLERHRLVALAEHVVARARTTGRQRTTQAPDSPAL